MAREENRRAFADEAKAMAYVIKSLYMEKDYIEEMWEKHHRDIDRGRLQMVEHFITLYENYC